MTDADREKVTVESTLIVGDIVSILTRVRGDKITRYYPSLFFWAIEGLEAAPNVTPVSKAIIGLFLTSAVTERTFKAGSRVHTKNRS